MKRIGNLGPLGLVTTLLAIYSLVVLVLSIVYDIYRDAPLEGGLQFSGYLFKFNWSLYLVWWLFLALLVRLAWTPFVAAWRDLREKGMLFDAGGKPATQEQIDRVCTRMNQFRRVWLIAAIMLSLGVTYFDTANLRDVHKHCDAIPADAEIFAWASSTGSGPARSGNAEGDGDQPPAQSDLQPLCGTSDAGAFQLVYRQPAADRKAAILIRKGTFEIGGLSKELEIDFSIAYLVRHLTTDGGVIGVRDKATSRRLNYVIYFQQVAAGAMAILAVFQLALICNLFWRLERAAWLNPEGLKMYMDPYSKLHEFGLERWNHALNNVYWVFALALLVPVASKGAQTVEGLDAGQVLLQFVIPIFVALPMIVTIIARQQRLPDIWPRIREETNPEMVELFHKQRLWPLDKNWASKLGIVVSFLLLSYLLGKNVLMLSG